MEIYLQQDGRQVGPYTEEQLRNSVASGTINQFDLARHDGLNDWQPLCTIIHIATAAPASPHPPAPASGTAYVPPPPPPPPPDAALPPPDIVSTGAPSPHAIFSEFIQILVQRSAVIGGWICFAIGFIVLIVFSWPFYIHFTLFVAAIMLSIEALSQRRIIGGLSLLLVTLMLPTIVGFGLLFYRANKAAEPISDASEKMQAEQKIED